MRAVVVVIAVALGCSNRSAEIERTALEATTALNRADETFPGQLTDALNKLGAALLINREHAAEIVKTKILPLVDSYLATIDHAVVSAEAYATDDEAIKRSLDAIRKRAAAFHKARERFATLEAKARAGGSVDELNQQLMSIGLMLSIGK